MKFSKMLQRIILCIGLLAAGSLGVELSSYIKPCDPSNSACLKESAEIALPQFVKGIEEFGIHPMDPLVTHDIDSKTDGLNLFLKDVVVHGVAKCKFNKVLRDTAKSTIFLDVECPFECVGNYKLNGKLFVLDVEGQGPFKIKGDKMRITVDVKMKQHTKGGVKHYKITGYDYNYEPLSKFSFKFDNLYNGDKSKAEPVNKILDESWKEILLSFGKPVIKEIVSRAVDNCAKFFINAPAEQIEIV